MERYYFTVRFIDSSLLPADVLAVKDFHKRVDVPGIGPAYGWVELAECVDHETMVKYGLLLDKISKTEPCFDPSLWERKYREKNIRQKARGEVIRVVHGFDDWWEKLSYAELEYSIEMYRRTATLIMATDKPWCVLYAVKHHDGDKISSCELLLKSFATAEEYDEYMADSGSDLVYTVYRREKKDGKS